MLSCDDNPPLAPLPVPELPVTTELPVAALVVIVLVVVGEAVRAAEASSAARSIRIASRLRPTTASFLLLLLLLPILGRFAGYAWFSLFDSGCALRPVDKMMGAVLNSFFVSLWLAAFFLRVA